MKLIEHRDSQAHYDSVAISLLRAAEQGLSERRRAALALAGGNTPMPIYQRLARSDIEWHRVVLLPTDERWVAYDHPAGNARAIAGALGGAVVRSLCPDQPGPDPDTATALASLDDVDGPFDAVLLGMGGDGHFASLFPHSPALERGLDENDATDALITVPDPLPPEAPFARVTLTLSRLLRTRRLMLAITGRGKLEVLQQATRPDADARQLPVAALLRHAGQALEIHWSP